MVLSGCKKMPLEIGYPEQELNGECRQTRNPECEVK
jgi:hypothetical protein